MNNVLIFQLEIVVVLAMDTLWERGILRACSYRHNQGGVLLDAPVTGGPVFEPV